MRVINSVTHGKLRFNFKRPIQLPKNGPFIYDIFHKTVEGLTYSKFLNKLGTVVFNEYYTRNMILNDYEFEELRIEFYRLITVETL